MGCIRYLAVILLFAISNDVGFAQHRYDHIPAYHTHYSDLNPVIKHRKDILNLIHNLDAAINIDSYLANLQDNMGRSFVSQVLNFSVEFLMDPNSHNNMITLLHYASYPANNVDVVKVLIKYGADPTIPDMYGNYPIHRAAWSADLDIIKYFDEIDFDLHLTDSYGWNLLMYASRVKNCDIVKFLIQEHMQYPINAQDTQGNTALHHAMLFNEPTWWAPDNRCVIKALRQAGAIQMPNNDDKVPSILAAERNDDAHIDALYAHE